MFQVTRNALTLAGIVLAGFLSSNLSAFSGAASAINNGRKAGPLASHHSTLQGIDNPWHGVITDPDTDRMRANVEFLCSKQCGGRLLGSQGERTAAHFLAKEFKKAGLQALRFGGFGGESVYHMPWSYPGATLTILNPDTPTANAWWLSEAVSRQGSASNVCGILPGTDPALKHEYLVVTAHYDHLGMASEETAYQGADDNASGTSGLIELVHCLKEFSPKRSIVFLACSGEEKGLLGSEAFIKSGVIPLDSIKGNVNLDMIGRNASDELHVAPAKTDGMVSSLIRDARDISGLHGITLSAGIEYFIRQSDHYTFARRGIPSVFFNTGLHPDLHSAGDTPDKLNYEKMGKIVRITRDLLVKAGTDLVPPYILTRSEWSSWQWGGSGFFSYDGGERLLGPPREE